MLTAISLFQQAVTLDPGFSLAWSGMAFTYSLIPAYSERITADEAARLALNAADKTLQLDPDNAEAYTARGRVYAHHNFKPSEARLDFERAYELAPRNINVVNLYGDFLTSIGDFVKAEEIELRAIDLDPLAAVHYSDMAFLMLMLQRNEEALGFARTAAELGPDSADRQDSLIIALTVTGAIDEAIELINWVIDELDVDPGYVNNWWCFVFYIQGDEANLRAMLAERLQQAEQSSGYYPYTNSALFAMWMDGTDAAIPLLEKARLQVEYLLTWPEYFYLPELISDDPAWMAFWEQPGLADLMKLRREFGPFGDVSYWRERPAK